MDTYQRHRARGIREVASQLDVPTLLTPAPSHLLRFAVYLKLPATTTRERLLLNLWDLGAHVSQLSMGNKINIKAIQCNPELLGSLRCCQSANKEVWHCTVVHQVKHLGGTWKICIIPGGALCENDGHIDWHIKYSLPHQSTKKVHFWQWDGVTSSRYIYVKSTSN